MSSATATAQVQHTMAGSKAGPMVCRFIVVILLTVGVLAFGATEPWSLLIMQVGSVVALLVWIAASWSRVRFEIDAALLLLISFGVLVLAQLVFHRSAYPYAGRQAMLQAAVPFVCFFLAKQLYSSEHSRAQFALWAQTFGGLLAIDAIVQALAGNGKIYWVRNTDVLSFFGPYANHNHYAGLMEMLFPFAIVSAVLESGERGKRFLYGFVSALMLASVFLSRSRSGILIVLFELFLVSAIAVIKAHHKLRIGNVLLAACAVALAAWIGGDAAFTRLSSLRHLPTDAGAVNRWQIAHDSLQLIRERPMLGWGFGTFSTVYPGVSTVATDSIINAAHDDYLQLLVETGITGLLLMVAFLFVVCRQGLRKIRASYDPAIAAALLGCAGLLLHSFTDFNLQIPANAAIFFALCGLICASTKSSRRALNL
ncbi:MAG TPA: O-antigen ligase family protein [Terriglobales bacterium]|nr:O-antigen ligase family protein [Terriglobales bacterium]